jgi:exodeoxyribonuclease VII large subunit
MSEPILLNVPFSEKDRAKKLGARWNGQSWYIPEHIDPEPFAEWLPLSIRKQYVQDNDSDIPSGIPLNALLRDVGQTVRQHYSEGTWVEANINQLQNNNHVYLDLADDVSKVKGIIFRSKADFIFDKFESQTCMKLSEGQKVLMKVIPSFSERFGMSLEVQDIHPGFTLGDMERQLIEIRRNLTERGIFDLNRSLFMPDEFTSVAVIAPEQAAGLGDFRTLADQLDDAGLCRFTYFSAQYQGVQNQASIMRAFDAILAEENRYDAIVMIRGGGDKSGLYELNREALAETVCNCPLPVFVGIGHERDKTILDEVATQSFPTPSMVVNHIGGVIISNGKRVLQALEIIRKQLQFGYEKSLSELDSLVEKTQDRMKIVLTDASEELDYAVEKFRDRALMSCDRALDTLNNKVYETVYKNPSNILNQGYCAITRPDGSLIKNADESSGDIMIRFNNGIQKGVLK